MNIISYRGPGKVGGVSSSLMQLWGDANNKKDAHWHFLEQRSVRSLKNGFNAAIVLGNVDEEIVAGHYRYCCEYLWPILHDLPEHATYNPEDNKKYVQFNSQVAQLLRGSAITGCNFVQDYQFALLPAMLNDQHNNIFWHTPWPRVVAADSIAAFAQIVRGMLGSRVIGFHIAQYAVNFLRFIEECLPEYYVDWESASVFPVNSPLYVSTVKKHRSSLLQTSLSACTISDFAPGLLKDYNVDSQAQVTTVVCAPVGVDINYWSRLMSNTPEEQAALSSEITALLAATTVVLSADRADVTKGVLERVRMIDRFFELHPERLRRVSFLQIVSRTRTGLPLYDNYWNNVRQLAEQINARWSTGGCVPILWIAEPLSPAQLSTLYRDAPIMLVNPICDGLNVTAKEYVICQNAERPGVLLLSPGAGVWTELGGYAVRTIPQDADQMCAALAQALTMPSSEKAARHKQMKKKIESWTLSDWWACFNKLGAVEKPARVNPAIKSHQAHQSHQLLNSRLQPLEHEHEFVVNTTVGS